MVSTGIEPQGKDKMLQSMKESLRAHWIAQRNFARRKPFRGKVAIRIELGTADPKTPSHIQTIAKNLLDLLGKHCDGGPTDEAVIYTDDSQVESLSVACQHGCEQPYINITAMPHRDYLCDLDLAAQIIADERKLSMSEMETPASDAIDDLISVLKDQSIREIFGEKTYESWVDMQRRQAQDAWLRTVRTDLSTLARLHQTLDLEWHGRLRSNFFGALEELFRTSPVSIDIGPLPYRHGATSTFKARIKQGLDEFLDRYRQLLTPLTVPVALEVFVKPPTGAPRGVLHDLDNVVRDYLIGPVLHALKPPSSYHFQFARDLDRDAARPMPPKAVRVGLHRYEVWRLAMSPTPEDQGFVSFRLVREDHGYGDSLRRIDDAIDRWRNN